MIFASKYFVQVIRETGFLTGVYTAEELDSNNVKDKESKIAFLNKLISAVSRYHLIYKSIHFIKPFSSK